MVKSLHVWILNRSYLFQNLLLGSLSRLSVIWGSPGNIALADSTPPPPD
jgi:hypothetical protein